MSARLALLIFVALCAGCGGGYVSNTSTARRDFYSGQFFDAAKRLEKPAHEDGKDQLLYLLDRATALHQAGDYDESNKDFLIADRLAEIKDYTSLSTEAATLLTSEEIKHYKGEEFEYVLISQYLALNFLMLQKPEDALVECRRVNHKLHRLISEGKRKYALSPMARYLAAAIYEDRREWNDAYVDYQGMRELLPGLPFLGEDLYRLAWRNRNRADMERWASEYQLSGETQRRIRETADDPEIFVIVENGRAPQKEPHPSWASIPHFVPKYNPTDHVDVLAIAGATAGEPGVVPARSRSYRLFDVEKAAIRNLDEKFGPLLAKKIAGLVAKEVISDQISRRTDPLIGFLVWLGLHASDTADTRSWLTLPKDFQVARIRLPREGGSFTVRFTPAAATGSEKIIRFEAGKRGSRVFVPIRLF